MEPAVAYELPQLNRGELGSAPAFGSWIRSNFRSCQLRERWGATTRLSPRGNPARLSQTHGDPLADTRPLLTDPCWLGAALDGGLDGNHVAN